MSDDSDDIYAWDNQKIDDNDNDDKGGMTSGGSDGGTTRSRRQSSRNDKGPQYKDATSSEEDVGENSGDDEVVIVDSDDGEEEKTGKRKSAASAKAPHSPKKKAPPIKPKSPKKSSPKASTAKKEEVIAVDDDEKVAAASSAKAKSQNGATNGSTQNEGIDVIIPHSLLNKHQGPGKNECTMLVQVESNDDTSHHLDFHGQSGAIGRFEADGDGVILDLKGYQYRGTIRPGPTAMIVALTRDGQFKVEAICDEFVTLDTNTKTDVMAKLDGCTKGDMDETYQYREDNVNANKKKGKGDDGKEDGDEGGKKGKKRASTAKSSGSARKKIVQQEEHW